MNYYRRYIADYLSKTMDLNMIEDGAYGRLLDYYYANEKPLPADADRVFAIARATKPAERAAVCAVLNTHFELAEDGYHNTRADKELGIAVPKIDKLRETARANGAKGGRPKKTKTGSETKTKTGSEKEPALVPEVKQPPTASHQPPEQNPPEERIPGDRHSSDSAATLGAAALAKLKTQALTLGEAKIPGGEDTPAALLASVLRANGIKGNAFHPLLIDWAREGIDVERLKAAIAKARQRPGKEAGSFGCEYLDPILHDETKPAAEVHAERASKSAAKSAQKAQQHIAESKAAAEHTAPMPEWAHKFVKHGQA